MKKVISGEKLQNKVKESIELLCGTVKGTLGPKGNNVIIDHSSFSPFITNDGVTIAKNIESDDEAVGAILEIVKEASIKTNEEVGDGTTSTLVLLENLYKESLEYINGGMNPILLKKELDKTLNRILEHLQKEKLPPTKEKILHIAKIAANDEELGAVAYKAFQKVKNKNAITITETKENKTEVHFKKGYAFASTLASPYFLNDSPKLSFKDAFVLLIKDTLTDIETISFILNDVMKNKKSVVIIARDYEEYVVQEITSLCLNDNLNACLIKTNEYGLQEQAVEKDIETITGAKKIEKNILNAKLGFVSNIIIEKEKVRIDFTSNEIIKKYIVNLKKESKETKEEFELEFIQKRIAMFTYGIAEILIGAPTKTECQERKMRLEDALCAVSASSSGILIGGGLSLLQMASQIKGTTEATKIWKKALTKPFEQILINAGLDYKRIKEQIEKKEYKVLYNVSKNEWEDSQNTYVIDPLLVVYNSLINASSIAGMLLTTTSLIINEHANNVQKVSDYTEL